MCMEEGNTCAMGETCCDGLYCCTGVPVPPGQEYCSDNCPVSDRKLKENFAPVNHQDILQKIVGLPVTSWNFIREGEDVRHVGPMAQDFRSTFDLGSSARHISTIDADGITLAAIQALHENMEKLAQENQRLRDEVRELREQMQKDPRPAPPEASRPKTQP